MRAAVRKAAVQFETQFMQMVLKSMRDASEFLETIIERERAITAAIFAGKDLPE